MATCLTDSTTVFRGTLGRSIQCEPFYTSNVSDTEHRQSLFALQARATHHPKRPRSVFQQQAYAEQPAKESQKHAGMTNYQMALSRGMQLLTSAAGLDVEPEDAQELQAAHQHAVQTKLSSNVSCLMLQATPAA